MQILESGYLASLQVTFYPLLSPLVAACRVSETIQMCSCQRL